MKKMGVKAKRNKEGEQEKEKKESKDIDTYSE